MDSKIFTGQYSIGSPTKHRHNKINKILKILSIKLKTKKGTGPSRLA
jgi:hypothetical protein